MDQLPGERIFTVKSTLKLVRSCRVLDLSNRYTQKRELAIALRDFDIRGLGKHQLTDLALFALIKSFTVESIMLEDSVDRRSLLQMRHLQAVQCDLVRKVWLDNGPFFRFFRFHLL